MTSITLYSLNYYEVRTYIVAGLFVLGNILLPQLCHLVPQGGMIMLPIYFFTLIGAYKYGLTVGILTAFLSPIVNHLLFGMPVATLLTPILVKSTILAITAGYTALHTRKVSPQILAAVVLTYQAIGSLFEFILTGSIVTSIQDLWLGLPGMIMQIIGGYIFIKHLLK